MLIDYATKGRVKRRMTRRKDYSHRMLRWVLVEDKFERWGMKLSTFWNIKRHLRADERNRLTKKKWPLKQALEEKYY